ncbi:ECF transporter S component [Microlunatus parietis]|uniref:Energy-coupling factor transport system substrate-specific component n=1 Tax=Microlunatus parietis TaxID=682979 RepID=A0A7Y9I8D0_9ACTN|nr:ECF transporter S component [Microlunatus parietis]NYE72198.1 energy-coupling factor transport system substrate-specific component [Microlunatus parietis]
MTTETTSADPHRAVGPLLRWRTVDLITAVMIGVAFGIAFIGWAQVTNLTGPLFLALPPLAGLLGGFWWLPAVIGGLIIRRPGAALLAMLVGASVEPLLGGQWGISTLGSGLFQGIGVELGFLIFGYRRFTALSAMLGGLLAGLLETPYEWLTYYQEWALPYISLYAVTMMISGALLGGLVGLALVKALAATGVLAPFPPGRERAAAHQV